MSLVNTSDDILDGHRAELRRGTVVVACLQVLRAPGYGYGLLQDLQEHGIETDANTLYPLLRRLEKQGLLEAEWNTDESRPRKFYQTSSRGHFVAQKLLAEWDALSASLAPLSSGESS